MTVGLTAMFVAGAPSQWQENGWGGLAVTAFFVLWAGGAAVHSFTTKMELIGDTLHKRSLLCHREIELSAASSVWVMKTCRGVISTVRVSTPDGRGTGNIFAQLWFWRSWQTLVVEALNRGAFWIDDSGLMTPVLLWRLRGLRPTLSRLACAPFS